MDKPEDRSLVRSRLSGSQDPVFKELDASIKFDIRLAPYDIAQSGAHARMLRRCGIITESELGKIERGLDQIEKEIEEDRLEVATEDEDIHMAIERRLTEIAGSVGGKLHTARSRNDQVATDMSMFIRESSLEARDRLRELMEVLLEIAEKHLDWPMPAYTHLQRAQPVYLSHHLLAYFWMFHRDVKRFNYCLEATDESPLGVGALAGVNWDTDRRKVAEELGFKRVSVNSIDAVSNRDYVLDFLAAAATCATHLSRLGAELVVWSSEEFGFLELDDSFTSGSSIMPQKKNPDAAELIRAKAPRVASNLATLYGVLHGLPLTYNKDMQEDKECTFDTADTLAIVLRAAAGMMRRIRFNREVLAQAAADDFLAATDVADLLVRKGLAFREAHALVGKLVRYALDEGKALSELEPEELTQFSDRFDEDFHALFSDSASLESKVSEGGTALVRVREQAGEARRALAGINLPR